jgi:hypothetical protein
MNSGLSKEMSSLHGGLEVFYIPTVEEATARGFEVVYMSIAVTKFQKEM